MPSTMPLLPDVGLILAAAGSGRRFGAGTSKLLLPWRGRAVFCHALCAFRPLLRPEHIVVVAPAEQLAEFRTELRKAGLPEEVRVVAGGSSRQESVANGLAAMPPSAAIIAIQDGARPLTSADLLTACVASAREQGSGVAARQVTDTIKLADQEGRVTVTPDRARLWAAETPQVFRRALIVSGMEHVRTHRLAITDDAQAVELAGHPVFLVPHTGHNPKITFPSDLRRLE